MVTLLVSHMRPILEYYSTVLGDTRKLEGMEGLDYLARLRELKLYSIYGRIL